MDEYIGQLKRNIEEVNKLYDKKKKFTNEQEAILNNIEIGSIHALAACEQAKQLERIADILDMTALPGTGGDRHLNVNADCRQGN